MTTQAPGIITDRVTAISQAGSALLAMEAIRDSTLPGTTLWIAADRAVRGAMDVIGELYRP